MEAEDHVRVLLASLKGEHRRSRGDRAGNWFGALLLATVPVLCVALLEAALRSWPVIKWTPVLTGASFVSAAVFAVWVSAFNRSWYRIDEASFECFAPWPHRSWRAYREQITEARLYRFHGALAFDLRLKDGARRKVPLTRSMAAAIGQRRGM
jgi:hypothetical protein